MKLPGRRGKDESEEDNEDLARARRERARRARANLAAKSKGEKPEDEESKDEPKREKPEDKKPKDEKREDKKTKDRTPKAKTKPSKERSETKPKRRERKKRPQPVGKRTRSAEEDDEKDSKRPKSGEKSKRPKASKRRRSGSGGAKRAGAGALTALKQGASETRKRAGKAAPAVGRGASGLVVSAFALFFVGFAFVLNLLIAVYRFVAGPVRTALRTARRVLEAVSRQVTPVRVLALVVLGAAILLALSQFADYRNISIGNDAYADGIQTVAPAPVRETAETGSAHSYLMIPLAAISLILLGAALTGRWRLCRLIALIGVVAIGVGLIHDRPTGLDTGEQAVVYTGVKATLLGGFYAQLFSGLLLTLSSLLLGRELRLAGARRPARASNASRSRRKLLRRDSPVEGARA